MGEIAARREASLAALAAALAEDMEDDFATWSLAWQELGGDQPHNPVLHIALAGPDSFAAVAARRYSGYRSAAWATAEEWATVGGEVDGAEHGLVSVTQVSVCCPAPACSGLCGHDARPQLKHRLLFNADQLVGPVTADGPPPPPTWTPDAVQALLGGLAVRWVFAAGPARYEGGTVATPSPDACGGLRRFASEALRGHVMWALEQCSQSAAPTVATEGYEHEMAVELAALYAATSLGIRYEPGQWPTAEEWPQALRSPAGWGVLLSAGTVALAAASLVRQAAAAAQAAVAS